MTTAKQKAAARAWNSGVVNPHTIRNLHKPAKVDHSWWANGELSWDEFSEAAKARHVERMATASHSDRSLSKAV